MSMTKKDFIALADVIRDYQEEQAHYGHIEKESPFLLDVLMDFCQSRNPRFKKSLWLAYVRRECGPNGGKVK